ncbi:MAG: hypothetical protein ACR650_06195 [Methylocystis sp.]|jgi:hypothetical protein
MLLSKSKIVPAAFWVGFLALGFVTSFAGPDKRCTANCAARGKSAIAEKAVVAKTEKITKTGTAAQD